MPWSLGVGPRKPKAKRKTELVNILEVSEGQKKKFKELMLKDFSLGKVKAASTSRLSDHQDRSC